MLITLLTDFGRIDGYVGAMKGVIASIAPEVSVVDLSHEVPPQDTRHAAFVWRAAAPFYPPDTIHVGVVDPGVGSSRRILSFDTTFGIFLVPDNGMIGYALPKRAVRRVVVVRPGEYTLEAISSTFHGRDIFAPAAAHLASGLDLGRLGRSTQRYRFDELPRPRRRRTAAGTVERGEIIHVDHYGNAISNIAARSGAELVAFVAASRSFDRIAPSYASVPVGRPVLLCGSFGWLEVAVRNGDAARTLGLSVGDCVHATWR